MVRWFYVARTGVRSLFGRRVFDEQLDADLQFHLEQATAEYLREGLSPENARRAALRAFGNPSDVMVDVREVSMWIWWERLAQDLQYGLRGFRRTPAFAAMSLLSVALGIGATTAIFSVYVPAFQREAEEETTFAIRSAGDPAMWAQSAKREIQTIAPAMLTTDVKALAVQRDERLVNERLLTLLSGCFAGLALLLAGIGVYGVVTYSVTQRTTELGLRIALGAQRAGLLWLVIRGTLTLVIVAALLGVTVAFMTSSLLSSFLFGIQPAEPWVYSGTVAVLIGIGLLSTVGPTLRAMRIDPVETLRWQ